LSGFDIGKAAALYNSRFEQFGRDIRTVGWGSRSDQWLRFDVLFRGIDPRGKTILDVGCGLGDLVSFLNEKTNGDFRYVGIDVAEELIHDATKLHGRFDRQFQVGDIFSARLPSVDISVLSGALSLKHEGIEAYAVESMKKMFEISQEAASLNFLSKYVDFELDKNMHYQPELVLAWAKKLSKKINLYHDYPLYEFTVQIFR
jgi:SAM-dependent methyltransferase